MTRRKKMLVTLLAAAMVLSLVMTAFAGTDGDPNECLYCGIGSYRREYADHYSYMDIIKTVTCEDYGEPYKDQIRQYTFIDKVYCTYEDCTKHAPDYIQRKVIYQYCVYKYGEGMSIGPEMG